jgi:hypothetical protein
MTQSQIEFIKRVHALACDNFKEEVENFFPELFNLPNGEWYKSESGSIVFKTGDRSGYGLDSAGEWDCWCNWSFKSCPKEWSRASKFQVEGMLTKEAKKRGFVAGARFTSAWTGASYNIPINAPPCFEVSKWNGDVKIYYPGQGPILILSNGFWGKVQSGIDVIEMTVAEVSAMAGCKVKIIE